MKLYLIDKTKKHTALKQELEDNFLVKDIDTLKIKQNKSDVVVACGTLTDEEMREMQGLKNIFFIVDDNDSKKIWKLVNNYNTIDIISENESEEYIARRILEDVNL